MSLPATQTQEARTQEAPIQEAPTKKPCQEFKGHTKWVRDTIYFPGRQQIITCSGDGSLRQWNLEDGSQIGEAWQDGTDEIMTMVLSPDGKTVASGDEKGDVRLWDIETGRVIAKWTGHNGAVWSIYWSRDGRRALSGSEDGTTRVWDVGSGETILGPIKTGHEKVYAVIYSPDGTMVATGGSDGVQIWDSKTFELAKTLEGHGETVYCLAWLANGRTLVSGSQQGSIRTWNTTTWEQDAVLLERNDVNSDIHRLAISPNGRILASSSSDHTVRLWDLENGQPIGSPLQHPDSVHGISFSADGRFISTGCGNSSAYTWDVSATVEKADFNDPLVDSGALQDHSKQSILITNAPKRHSKSLNCPRRIPQGFFDDDHIHRSSTPNLHIIARQPSTSHERVLLDHLSSLFSRTYLAVRNVRSHFMPAPSRSRNSTLTNFFRHPRSGNEYGSPEANVPYMGQAKNIKVKENSKKVTVLSNIVTITTSTAGPSRPQASNGGAAQQSSGGAPGQKSSSQSQLALNIAPTTTSTAIAMPTSGIPAHTSGSTVVRQVGCFLSCTSAEMYD